MEDEAIGDNILLADHDMDIFQGFKEAIGPRFFREDFSTFPRYAPAGFLKWPSSETLEFLDFSIYKLKSSRKSVAQARFPTSLHTSRALRFEILFADTESLVAREIVDQVRVEDQDQSRKHSLSKLNLGNVWVTCIYRSQDV